MSLPPLGKQSMRILVAILNALRFNWGGLSQNLRRLVAPLFRPFLRTLYRCRPKLNTRDSRETPNPDKKQPTPRIDKSGVQPIPDHLKYTVIHHGHVIPLDNIATSVYPFPGGSIRNASQANLGDRSRPPSPNGRLAPSNRSSTSVNRPYSTSHTPPSSMYDINYPGTMDGGPTQIESRDIPTPTQGARHPQRKDSEVPGISVEGADSPITEKFTPVSPIEEEPDSVLTPRASFDRNPTFLDVPGGSAASSRTQFSASNSSITSSASISWDDGWDLNPTFPGECLRYQRRTKIRKRDTDIVMEPLQLKFEEFQTPSGWTRYAHPEGCCYYYNENKRIYTDAELQDPAQLERIEEKIEQVDKAKEALGFPINADVVLNLYGSGEEQNERQYFCLDHDRRIIFFFHTFQAQWVPTWGEVKGAFSKDHWRYELESQYWYAVQMYPHHMKLSRDMVDELRDIVLYFIGDTMSSPYSTSEFSLDNLQKILSITSNVKDNIETKHTAGCLCLVARFMFVLYHSRFLNFHGESYARIERNFSVYGDALYPRTVFLKSLSFLLFSSPDVHLKHLQKMWVDKIIHKAVWEDTLKKFSTEWQELVTSAAILLNANIAFLAIQSVDQTPPARSWAQIVSYASVVANVGGMILGLLLLRQHRNITQETSDHVHTFLMKHDYNTLGLEALAVMFSLPYALLMWGMISFLGAFSLMCLEKAEADTTITVSASLGFVGVLISTCIYLGWENNGKDTSTENRNLAYYPPKEEESETSSTASASARDVAPLSRRRSPSASSNPLPTPKTESLQSRPDSRALQQRPRIATVLIDAFRCVYTLGRTQPSMRVPQRSSVGDV